jgi:GNAT superfamily N-acetyltransferase
VRILRDVQQTHLDYFIDDDIDRLDFARIHAWLTTSYWSPGIPRDLVERAARGSALVVGAYLNDEQAGYLRVISDRATFAWVADVFVDEAHRGKGLAKAMLRFCLDHADYQGLRRWVLATKDAHDVYASLGFTPLPEPQRWMIYKPKPSY